MNAEPLKKKLSELCEVCGCTRGAHRFDSFMLYQCPLHEGQNDWPHTNRSRFTPSGRFGEVEHGTPNKYWYRLQSMDLLAERLAGVLARIDGGDNPVDNAAVLRRWAYEGLTLGRSQEELTPPDMISTTTTTGG